VARPAVAAPRDLVFDVLLEGTRLAPGVLAADREARVAGSRYGDAYYRALRDDGRAGSVLERRLNESIAAVAAVIAGAWDASGRPLP